MPINVLEDIICRVHVLTPCRDGLWEECCALGALIIRGRAPSYRETVQRIPIVVRMDRRIDNNHREKAAQLLAGLILLDVIMGQRIGRPARFSNIVRQLRDCRAHRGVKRRKLDPYASIVLETHPAFAAMREHDRQSWVRTCLTDCAGPASQLAMRALDALFKSVVDP
jgi:hypothetical protein